MADAEQQQQQQPVAVDETPISSTNASARKNSLENHLMNRPDKHELVESMQNEPHSLNTSAVLL
jgi:hypothetical protein